MADKPYNWQDIWGEYQPGVNDFTSVMVNFASQGNNAAAAMVEQLRNNYVNSEGYTGKYTATNYYGNAAGNVATAANNVVEKITEPVKAAADQSAEKQTETKVIYSAFDPSGYATITPEVASETGGKILGYGIIAVIGLVILDKLFA